MAEYIGNGIPLPGVTEVAPVGKENLLYSTEGLAVTGITVASTGALIKAGTVLGIVTASGKGAAYATANADGTETAVGVLLDDVDTSNGDALANLAIGGYFLVDQLTGLDAAGVTDLAGREITLNGVSVLAF